VKKIASILLLLLLFFNWVGYRLVSDFLQNRSDSKLEAKLDRNEYDDSQLTEIRVPLSLPYYTGSQDFERFNGEIEIGGMHYNYVKRKVENGDLVLLCIPNTEKKMIQSARDDFFKMVNDLPQNSSGKKSDGGNSIASKTFCSEYRQEMNNWELKGVVPNKFTFILTNSFLVSFKHTLLPEQPPES